MPLPREVEEELQKLRDAGMATSGTPNQIRNSGNLNWKPYQLPDSIQGNQKPTQIKSLPPEVEQELNIIRAKRPYAGPVVNESPLTKTQRFALSTPEDVEGKKNILRTFGFEPLQDKDGNLLVRSGDKVYNVDEKGFSLGDIAELFGQGLTTAAGVGGAVVGGIAGTAVAPGIGTLAGAAGGGAIGAGLAEWIGQKIGQRAGSKEETQVSDIIEEAAFGALNSIGGFGGSTAAKLGIRSVSTAAKEAAEIVAREAIEKGSSRIAAKLAAQQIIESDLRRTLGGRIISEATEGAIGGAVQSGAGTLYETGDVGEALKAGALGFGIGSIIGGGVGVTPLSRLGYKTTSEIQDIANRGFGRSIRNLRTGQSRATIKEIEEMIERSSATAAEKQTAREILQTYKPKAEDPVEFTYKPIEEGAVDTGLPKVQLDSEIQTPRITDERVGDIVVIKGKPSGDNPHGGQLGRIIRTEDGQLIVDVEGVNRKDGTGIRFNEDAVKPYKDKTVEGVVSPADTKNKVFYPQSKEAWLKEFVQQSTEEPRIIPLPEAEGDIPTIKRGAPSPTERQAFEEGLPTVREGEPIPEEAVTPDERLPIIKEGDENLPIIDYGPTEEGEVDLDDFIKKLGIESTTSSEVNTPSNKFVDWIMTPFDNIINPDDAGTRIGRSISRSLGRLGNIIAGIPNIGKRMFNDLREITKVSDRFNIAAKKALNKFAKTKARMTQWEYEQFWMALQQNNAANPDRIFDKEEIKSKLLTTTLQRQAADEWFEVTRDMSAAQAGRLFKDASGNINRVAQTPSLFAPIRRTADDSDDAYREALDKQIKKLTTGGMSENEARAKAARQLEHTTLVGAGEARKKHYSSFKNAQDAGVDTDLISVGEKWIAANSRKSAMLDVFGKQGKYLGKETEDMTTEEISEKYINDMIGEMQLEVDKWVSSKKMDRDEAIALSKLLNSQINVVLKGKQLGSTIKDIRRAMSFRLSLSAIKNVFQLLFLSLENDMPSLWRGLRAAYLPGSFGKVDPELANMFKTPEGFTTKAGSGVEEITEGVLDEADDGVMVKALNFILKPLRWTEEKNRIASSVAGATWSRTLRDAVNDTSLNVRQRQDAARRLGLLLDRDIDINQKVVLDEKDYMNAAYNNTKETQFGYDPLRLPWWTNTPAGTLAFQFKSFAYNQTAFLWRNTVDEVRYGNYGRATRNFVMLASIMGVAGEVARAMDNILYGQPDETDQNIVNRWLENVANVGSFGLLTDALRSTDGKSMVINSALGPVGTAAAQSYDLGKSILTSDDPGETLEDTFNFALKQAGGAGRVVRGFTEGKSHEPF